MGKINQNFTTWKGNLRKIRFSIDDVANVETCVFTWSMSATKGSTPIITKVSTSNPAGITMSGKYATVLLLVADTNEASGLAAGAYYHELRMVDTLGEPSTPSTGTMTLEPVTIKAT